MKYCRLIASQLCIAVFLAATSAVQAATFVYDLNGTLAEASGGPSLVAHGGTLGPAGYAFGPNTGLSVSGTGAFDAYSIEIRFEFDSVNASFNGYQRVLDFKNRAIDAGLYSRNGLAEFFVGCCSGPGGTGGSSAGQVFFSGQTTNLLMSRSSSGLFSLSVNGNLAFSFLDTTGLATFTGPNNIIWFFMDDFESLANFPNTPEAGTGFVDSIRIETSPVPLPPSIIAQAIGLGLLGLLAWRRRRQLPVNA